MTTTGLSSAEARARLAAEGPNALPEGERHGLLALVAGVLREPMFLLLLGAAPSTSSSATCARRWCSRLRSSWSSRITLVPGAQDRARARGAARPVEPARARDPRRRASRASPGREVVRGDLAAAARGRSRARRRRPARGRRASAVDESLLTGESVPVASDAGPWARATASSSRHARRRAATALRAKSRRRARAREMGRIGTALATIEHRSTTPLRGRDARAWCALFAIVAPRAVRAVAALLRRHARRLARRRCSPGSRWRWRSCRRSSRSC